MTNIYYITSSGLVIVARPESTAADNVFTSSSLQLTASVYYTTTGSITSSAEIPQISVQSGSTVYAIFPLQNTSIYYNIYPPYFAPDIPDAPSQGSASFAGLIEFTSNDISGSSFLLYNTTKTTGLVSSSDITYSEYLPLTRQDLFQVEVSGSGQFYISEIQILDTTQNKIVTTATGTNTPITASFTNTGTDRYSILINTATLPYISMSFSSSTSIPVSPTSSITAWNTYFQTTGSNPDFSASVIQNIGNGVALGGGSLQSITGSLVVEGVNLTNFYSLGLSTALEYSLANNKITTLPNITVSASAANISLGNNLITGILPDIILNSTLKELTVSNNLLSGSIPNLSSSLNLNSFDVSNNYLSLCVTKF